MFGMSEPQPAFSIVIPTYGRPAQLANCLQSLVELDYPRGSFEVIVVDDGGDPSPSAVVETISRRLDVALVRQAHAGPAAARNAGARQARSEFLAFTDDDCAPTPAWLQELAQSLRVARGALVGGLTINALPNNLFAEASQALVNYLY
jgi:glycosyltransferase involved in cell wall biosynthesis